MALNLEGWVTPEQRFEGLYKISDDLRANRSLEQQDANERARLRQKEEAQKNATSTYLQSYLNPKHFLTGTNFDPVITTDLSGVLQKAMSLASQGLDSATITYSIAPDVEDIAEGSQRVKAEENKRKQTLAQLHSTGVKGIDYDKFNTEYKKAYGYEGGNLKPYSSVDNDRNYADEVLRNADVFNNEGLKDFVAKSGKETVGANVKVIGRDGRMRQTVADITKPDFMVQEIDPVTGAHKGFVPKYEIATDEDNKIVHDFGEQGTHPVRLLDQAVFDQLMHEAGSGGFIRQEVRRLAKDKGVDISSPQGELLARAIAYDELNDSGKKYSTLKERSVEKAAPERPYSFYHGSSVAATEQPKTINLFEAIDKMASQPGRMQANPESKLQMNLINSTAQKIILDIARDAKQNKFLDVGDIYLKKNADDEQIYIRDAKTHELIAPLDPNSLNIPANAEIFKLATNKGKTEAQRKIDISTGKGVRSTKTTQIKAKSDPLGLFK